MSGSVTAPKVYGYARVIAEGTEGRCDPYPSFTTRQVAEHALIEDASSSVKTSCAGRRTC